MFFYLKNSICIFIVCCGIAFMPALGMSEEPESYTTKDLFAELDQLNGSSIARVKKILQDKNVHVNDYDEHGRTPLIVVMYSENKDLLSVILGVEEINVNKPHKIFGITPLMAAASVDNVEFVKALLAHGADIDAQDAEGKTVFDKEYTHNNEIKTTIYKSIENKSQIVNPDPKKDVVLIEIDKPIAYTVQDLFKELDKEPGEINMQRTAEIVQSLGSDINALGTKADVTPLARAIARGHGASVVKLLLNHPKIEFNKRSGPNYKAPLYMAIKDNFDQEKMNVVQLLLRNGARVTAGNLAAARKLTGPKANDLVTLLERTFTEQMKSINNFASAMHDVATRGV